MSGLIFIFIITLAVFALRLAKATTELTNAEDMRTQVVQAMADTLRKAGIDVTIDPEQGVLRLTERAIQFPKGESEPEEEYRRNVGVVAEVLLRVLRCHVAEADNPRPHATPLPSYCAPVDASWLCGADQSGAKVNTVLVEGHSDNVPIIGKGFHYKDNLDLSAARSAEIFQMMLQCEPGLRDLLNRTGAPVLSVSGYGETRPVLSVSGDAGPNRRIDLRFVMEPPEAKSVEPPAAVEQVRHELGE
ncbi:MAG: hypothetical protein IT293_00730 [Deltaproteobacteria bacterium]|nr:hypothetical protein [Deltaproteobacteria bacterium]